MKVEMREISTGLRAGAETCIVAFSWRYNIEVLDALVLLKPLGLHCCCRGDSERVPLSGLPRGCAWLFNTCIGWPADVHGFEKILIPYHFVGESEGD